MKVIFGDQKSGHSFQKELEKGTEKSLIGKKLGDEIDGGIIGLEGYKLKITGGSDKDGFPMRSGIKVRGKVLMSNGAGVAKMKFGMKVKKRVAGQTITENTAQVNCKVTTAGPKTFADLGYTPKPKEAKPAEAKK